MSATHVLPAESTTTRSRTRSIWSATAVTGIAAAAVTTAGAALARAAGIALDVDGEQIPLLGFAQMTLIGAVIGGVLASVFAKWARRPRRTFVVTTVTLTTLSLVPDVTMEIGAASAIVLMLTHVAAAAIVIPPLARRLP